MYSLSIRPSLDEKLKKLAKKDKNRLEIIMKKADDIVVDPAHYKNLRKPLAHLKRVHINSHFVLTFSVDEKTKTVILEDFDHHDKIYLN